MTHLKTSVNIQTYIMYPMCKKTRFIECTIQNAYNIGGSCGGMWLKFLRYWPFITFSRSTIKCMHYMAFFLLLVTMRTLEQCVFNLLKVWFFKYELLIFFRRGIRNLRAFENMFFALCSTNCGLVCSLSNRGEEVSMCHFKEIVFWLKKYILGASGVLKLS